jgi:hypothetical protein
VVIRAVAATATLAAEALVVDQGVRPVRARAEAAQVRTAAPIQRATQLPVATAVVRARRTSAVDGPVPTSGPRAAARGRVMRARAEMARLEGIAPMTSRVAKISVATTVLRFRSTSPAVNWTVRWSRN